MSISPPDSAAPTAALSRHLQLLGKALGKTVEVPLDLRPASQSLPAAEEALRPDEGAAAPAASAGRSGSASQRLRELAGISSRAPARGVAASSPAESSPQRPGAGRNGSAGPSSDGLSAVQRLRQKAAGLAPKRLERREDERRGAPLVPGGPALPVDYPDAAQWPDDDRPPGSRYSAEQWALAAKGQGAEEALDAQRPDAYAVIEVLGAAGSVLMRIPRVQRIKTYERQGGQIVEKSVNRLASGVDEAPSESALFFGQVFDRCLIVMPDAHPAFPGAVEGKRHRHGHHDFWVIRPRAHYLDAQSLQSFWCGARWSSEGAEPLLRAEPDDDMDARAQDDAPSEAPSPGA